MDIYFYGKKSKEKRYQYVVKHLAEYGNTIIVDDVEYIHERLLHDGIQHTIRKVVSRSEGGRINKKEIFWVVEVSL